MRPNPAFASTDVDLARELIRENPWAILVTIKSGTPVASHYPVMLDEEAPGLELLTHLGRPDEEVLGIDEGEEREILVIVQGHHGYISPSWYKPGTSIVPTWNFSAVHLHGVPQILGEDENLNVLTDLVERFESEVEEPLYLETDAARPIAKGTLGLRIPVERFQLKRKLSQNKDDETRIRVIAALRSSGPFEHRTLADEMERELETRTSFSDPPEE
jgi:transcriptional regulator